MRSLRFGLALLAACSPPTPSPQVPAPSPLADLSGDWISGLDQEPAEQVVTVARTCGQTVAHWRFTHRDSALSGILLRSVPVQGEPHDLPVAEHLAGVVNGMDLSFNSPEGSWSLRYDGPTGHLRGTRSGRSIWFAPLRTADPAECQDALSIPRPFSLSGSWMTGLGAADPPVAVVTIHTSCAHHPAAWVIDQDGDSVRAWSFPESFEQGIARRDSPARVMPATGRVSGYLVTLSDANDRYELRYDPESGHLRGKRNGKWFWAAPQRIVGPGACPGIP